MIGVIFLAALAAVNVSNDSLECEGNTCTYTAPDGTKVPHSVEYEVRTPPSEAQKRAWQNSRGKCPERWYQLFKARLGYPIPKRCLSAHMMGMIDDGTPQVVPSYPKVIAAAWLGKTPDQRAFGVAKIVANEAAYEKACYEYRTTHARVPEDACRPLDPIPEYKPAPLMQIQCENTGNCRNGYQDLVWRGISHQIPASVWKKLAHARTVDVLYGVSHGFRASEINERVQASRVKILDAWADEQKRKRDATEIPLEHP